MFVGFSDSPGRDAFGRLRVSSPVTIFTSKYLVDAQPLLWDDVQTTGSGTTSVHSVNRASVTMTVSSGTFGTRVRQTFRRFNYQPGKSHQIMFTSIFDGTVAGTTKRAGYFDENNGIFFENNGINFAVVLRSKVTGTAADTRVPMSSWNLDKMDGTGPSGLTLNLSLIQIFFIDFSWLGSGRVRIGFMFEGEPHYVHEFVSSNVGTSVYMSSPNLPLRCEISNDGTGISTTLENICFTVMSEGESEGVGQPRYISNGSTFVNANAAGTTYGILSIRLKSGSISSYAELSNVTVLGKTNDSFEWTIVKNSNISGTLNYNSLGATSTLEFATASTANIATGGTAIVGGYTSATTSRTIEFNELGETILGSSITGSSDTLTLCVKPLTTGVDVYGGVIVKEIK